MSEYPKDVIIQPTDNEMRAMGYNKDENSSQEDIDEFDYMQGFKREPFVLEDENTELPSGYELATGYQAGEEDYDD